MAVDRIGPSGPPLSTTDRAPQARPAQPQGSTDETDYALAPLDPGAVGAILDELGGAPLLNQAGAAAALAMAAADAVLAGDPAAMRPNQVFLSRQLVWQPPDTAMMANSWYVMVRAYSDQRAAVLEQSTGQHVPASLFMADNPSGTLHGDGRPALPMVTEMEPWRFAVYAWGAEQLVLRVLARDNEHGDPRRRRRVVLRLELMLPGVGRVVIQMEPAGSGVILEVGAQQNAAMSHMREMLPQLAALISRGGLTILRCKLMRELPALSTEPVYPTRSQTSTLSHALFKAMAEVAVLLSQPQMPEDQFSERA